MNHNDQHQLYKLFRWAIKKFIEEGNRCCEHDLRRTASKVWEDLVEEGEVVLESEQ